MAAADVTVPSGLSAAALSAGKVAYSTPPALAAHQQAGHPSAVPAKRQEPAADFPVSPALVSKLPLFFLLLLQRYQDGVNRPAYHFTFPQAGCSECGICSFET